MDIRQASCVVVGGGAIAQRKAAALLRAGAMVSVVSPRFCAGLERMAARKKITAVRRRYFPGSIRRAELVIAATDDRRVNARVAADCRLRRIPVNAVDDPAHCTFIMPAVAGQAGLIVAVSTCGQAPSLSKRIKNDLQVLIRRRYLPLLKLVSCQRKKLKAAGVGFSRRKEVLTRLSAAGSKGRLRCSAR